MTNKVTVAILAGGQGRRFGGQDKGLVDFCGKPLIEHILQQISVDTTNIVINANRNQAEYKRYGYPVIEDTLADYQGPLAGFASVMAHSDAEFVLMLPCDVPNVPQGYMAKMLAKQAATGVEIVVASDGTCFRAC